MIEFEDLEKAHIYRPHDICFHCGNTKIEVFFYKEKSCWIMFQCSVCVKNYCRGIEIITPHKLNTQEITVLKFLGRI